MNIKNVESVLEQLYELYHKPQYISPDPLQFLYDYKTKKEIEIVGLIASAFAIGRVEKILEVIQFILKDFQDIHNQIRTTTLQEYQEKYTNFKYRFYNGNSLSHFLNAIGKTINQYGSIENCIKEGYNKNQNMLEAQTFLVETLAKNGTSHCGNLIPNPQKGSACKRLNLYLRWMIRKDDIDLGIWDFDKSQLIIPLDTHIFQLSKMLGISKRNSANLKTALEITENLKKIDKSDPTRFDFSLSRLGIHPELDYKILSKLE